MSSTLSARTQQRRIQIAKEKALRGIPVGIENMSSYQNPDKKYWENVNDVRKYFIQHDVGCNKYMSFMRIFSAVHRYNFFDFVYNAVLMNLKDAERFKKEERIEASFQRAVSFAKFAWAQANDDSSYTSHWLALRSRLVEFRDKAERDLGSTLCVPSWM